MKERGMKWFNFVTKIYIPIKCVYTCLATIFIIVGYIFITPELFNKVECIGCVLKIINTIAVIYIFKTIKEKKKNWKREVYYYQYFLLIYHILLQLKVVFEPGKNYENPMLIWGLATIFWGIVFGINIIYFLNRCDEKIENDFKKEKEIYCINCGKKINSEWEFCKFCGKKIERLSEENIDIEKSVFKVEELKNKKGLKILIIMLIIIALVFVSIIIYNIPVNIENIKDSVVMIEVYDKDKKLISTGSGFCVFNSECIVTNFHVIEGAYEIKIITDDNIKKSVDNIDIVNKTKDMAILKGDFGLVPLKIGNTKDLRAGMEVSAIGSPEGEMNTVSTGIISNADNDYQIRITTPISPGSSGGVLLNKKNQVIGVTYATYNSNDAQNLNYAIKIDYFEKMYESIDSGENLLLVKEIDSDKNYRPKSMTSFYRWTNPKELFYYDRLELGSSWQEMFDELSEEEQNNVVSYYWTIDDYKTTVNVDEWEEIDYILNLTNLTKAEYVMVLNDLSQWKGKMFNRINSYNFDPIDKSYIAFVIGGMKPRDISKNEVNKLLDDVWNSSTYSREDRYTIMNYLGFSIDGDKVSW